MTWKNWGDHPIVVGVAVSTAVIAIGYTIYDHHFKSESSAPSSLPQPSIAPTLSPSTDPPASPSSPQTSSASSSLPSTKPSVLFSPQPSFISSPSPSAKPKIFTISWLDKRFKWDQGGNPESRYAIEASNTILKIVAGSNTDHNKLNTHLRESPRMSFPAQCDRNFEASVKVKFRSTVSAQRAIFGVGDSGRKSKYMYIYSLESSVGSVNSRVESAITSPSLNNHTNPVDYKSELLHLKIKNISGTIDLLYSENNLDWRRSERGALEFPMKMRFPKNCELYFEVLSTIDEQVSGEFSDFLMKYY